jgi:glc operon protein GlcG
MSEFVASQPTLTYAGARAVLDAAGHQLAFARMDGAALLSESIATDKAYSVVAFLGLPTSAWDEVLKSDAVLREGLVHRDRLVIFGGGLPVVVAGAIVGAVGVSGGSVDQDEEVAKAGAAALA